MAGMNKALQVHQIEKMLKNRHGIHDFDVTAHVDPRLTLPEMIDSLEQQLGISIRKQEVSLGTARDMEQDGNMRMARSTVHDMVEDRGWRYVAEAVRDRSDQTIRDIADMYGDTWVLDRIRDTGVPHGTILWVILDVEDNIKQLVREKPQYRDKIEQIVDWETNNPDSEGWTHSDVMVNPGRLSKLEMEGIIEEVDSTGTKQHYTLTDTDRTEQVLESVSDQDSIEDGDGLPEDLADRVIDDRSSHVTVTEEDRERFASMAEDRDMVEYMKQHIAPGVHGREDVKTAVLLQLASMWDNRSTDDKNRINILLYGPPGTGKSSFKSWYVREFGAIDVNGDRASKPDLTYNKKTEEYGHLAKAHHDYIVVEEADEMDNDAFGSVLTAIGETGYVKIRDKQVEAECKGLFLANDVSNWKPEVLDRFTFRVEMEAMNDIKRNEALQFRYKHWNKQKPGDASNELHKYMQVVQEHTPEIRDLEAINKFKQDRIDKFDTMRTGLEIMRIALAIARVNLSHVTEETFMRAFKLYHNLNNGDDAATPSY